MFYTSWPHIAAVVACTSAFACAFRARLLRVVSYVCKTVCVYHSSDAWGKRLLACGGNGWYDHFSWHRPQPSSTDGQARIPGPSDIPGSTIQEASAVNHLARNTPVWNNIEKEVDLAPVGSAFEDYAYLREGDGDGSEGDTLSL